MLHAFEQIASGNAAGGFPLSRIVCRMDWAAEGKSYLNDLIEFESRVNHVWEHHDDAVICTYHLGKFGGDTVIDIMCTHPIGLHPHRTRSAIGCRTRSESYLASLPSAPDARKQPPRSIRCRRRPRWKRQAGGYGRRRRSYFREYGASSSRRALMDQIVVRSTLNSPINDRYVGPIA